MAGGLRKVPGTPPELGIYAVSGSLDGMKVGRRVVKCLRVRGLSGDTREGLGPIRDLPHLRKLELDHLSGVDLSPLAGLRVETLTMRWLRDLDLAPLGELSRLRLLLLWDVEGCRIPEKLPLASSLQTLTIGNDRRVLSGAPIKQLIDAIDWPRLSNLRVLSLAVGGMEMLAPIEIDIGFLRRLDRLEVLDIARGIDPARGGPSLLEPPFDAVPPSLRSMRVSVEDPEASAAAVLEHLGWEATVYPRAAPDVVTPSWTPIEMSDAFDGDDLRSEYDAERLATRRLRATDPALLKRLDLDTESAGTGITAPTREDLASTLRILGIVQP